MSEYPTRTELLNNRNKAILDDIFAQLEQSSETKEYFVEEFNDYITKFLTEKGYYIENGFYAQEDYEIKKVSERVWNDASITRRFRVCIDLEKESGK